MPVAAYCASLVSVGVLPAVLALIGAGTLLGHYLGESDDLAPATPKLSEAKQFEGLLGPALTFLVVTQAGLWVTFLVSLRKGCRADYDYWKGRLGGYDAIFTYFTE